MGGLDDGLLTVPYVVPLSAALPSNWRLVQPLLSSSYNGWGTSSLDRDVEQIAECIEYISKLRPHGKVILMGHSTGSQDIMHYLLSPKGKRDPLRPLLQGAILQGGVSDREFLTDIIAPDVYEKSMRVAESYVREGRGADVLPTATLDNVFFTPISARRWLSLASPPSDYSGEDDYFSSDFSDERLGTTFGKIGSTNTPLQILYGESDQYVPEHVDKELLFRRWTAAVKEGGGVVDEDSGVLEGADHTLRRATEEVFKDFIARVVRFVERVEKDVWVH